MTYERIKCPKCRKGIIVNNTPGWSIACMYCGTLIVFAGEPAKPPAPAPQVIVVNNDGCSSGCGIIIIVGGLLVLLGVIGL